MLTECAIIVADIHPQLGRLSTKPQVDHHRRMLDDVASILSFAAPITRFLREELLLTACVLPDQDGF